MYWNVVNSTVNTHYSKRVHCTVQSHLLYEGAQDRITQYRSTQYRNCHLLYEGAQYRRAQGGGGQGGVEVGEEGHHGILV